MYYLRNKDLVLLIIDNNLNLVKLIKKLNFKYIENEEPDLIIINKYNKLIKKMNLRDKTIILNNSIKKIRNLKLKKCDVYRCGFDRYDDIYYSNNNIYYNKKIYKLKTNLNNDEIINKMILINICLLCGFNCLNSDFIV